MKINFENTYPHCFELLPRISIQKELIAFEWMFWCLWIEY